MARANAPGGQPQTNSRPAAGEWPIRLRVPDERARLPELLDAVAAALRDAAVDGGCIHDAQLVVEELACNLMDHGVRGGVDALAVGLAIEAGRVVVEIRDNGAAYDPLAHPVPDLEADLDQRPIGGLGIHLVRELSQRTVYRREDGWNVLRIELDAILPAT